jgi:hypothetical protein
MEGLEPGVGNIFAQASSLLGGRAGADRAVQRGADSVGSLPHRHGTKLGVLQALAGLGALLTGVDPASLPDMEISLDTLDGLGVNTRRCATLGKESLTCRRLARSCRRCGPQTSLAATARRRASPAGHRDPAQRASSPARSRRRRRRGAPGRPSQLDRSAT